MPLCKIQSNSISYVKKNSEVVYTIFVTLDSVLFAKQYSCVSLLKISLLHGSMRY